MTYKSKSCQNFEIIIILHNFDLDTFTKEYPIHAHRLILLSNIGIDKIISEIEPQLKLKNNLDKEHLGEAIISTEMNVGEKIEDKQPNSIQVAIGDGNIQTRTTNHGISKIIINHKE